MLPLFPVWQQYILVVRHGQMRLKKTNPIKIVPGSLSEESTRHIFRFEILTQIFLVDNAQSELDKNVKAFRTKGAGPGRKTFARHS